MHTSSRQFGELISSISSDIDSSAFSSNIGMSMSPTPWWYPKSSDGMSISATVRPLVGLLGGEGGGGPVLDNWDRSLKIEARAFPFQSLYVMSSMSLFF